MLQYYNNKHIRVRLSLCGTTALFTEFDSSHRSGRCFWQS